ncbi:hypothetical protein Tsubulata_041977 [Turnera subulata]|uniref:Uncharacterized protein n=1 Tax=Turnera subulata TaxID=218843 RepID=A0A9Q0FTS7_9ROSI|nr:hypothetical protein Tsubulata_041977 [Turnera subulata]
MLKGHLSLASSSDTGSSSSSAISEAADRSEVMVGQPQPFTGHNIFENGERVKYTKVNLPGRFKKRSKLWVNYGEMHLRVVEAKFGTETEFRNFDQGFGNLIDKVLNGEIMFMLNILAKKEKEKPSAHPSGEESVLYTKVELPGIYGEAVKLWVKSDIVIGPGQELKNQCVLRLCGSPDFDSLILSFIPQSKE